MNTDVKDLTVGSLYAGVGGIDKGMKQAGFQIAWANEVNSHACKTYQLNHPDTQLVREDVHSLDISRLPAFDILVAGFPCQPFSVAGYREGFDDPKHGNHFMRIMQIVDEARPSVIFLENVRNFKSHDKGRTYQIAVSEISRRGYWYKDAILNTSTHANIPQNRERFFLVAFSDKTTMERFSFPGEIELRTSITDIVDHNPVDECYYYTSKSKIYDRVVGEIVDPKTLYQWRRKYVRENKKGHCPTLTANMGTGGHNVPIWLSPQGIRKLTPQECFRFQGFPDIELPEDTANSHLYKQAGNSVTVPLIKRVGLEIKSAISV